MEEKEQELKPKRKARTVRKETKTPISKEQSPVQITEKRVENPIQVQITELYKQNIQSVIIEGGTITLQSFIDISMWDEARIFTTKENLIHGVRAPKIIGNTREEVEIGVDHLKILYND